MSIQILDPRTCSSWDELLLCSPGASFFHSSAWAPVLSESYGYTPLYFTVIENGKLRALVPVMEVNSILTGKRGVSLPFTDYCEPIINEAGEFDDLFNSVVEYGKKQRWKYIELRGGDKYLRSLEPRTSNLAPGPSSSGVQPSAFSPQPFEAPGPSLEPRTSNPEPVAPKVPRSSILVPDLPFRNLHSAIRNLEVPRSSNLVPVFRSYLGHTLDLSGGEEKIFSSLRDSTRRNIKKATAQRVVAKISIDLEGIKEFFGLNCITRRRHGLPPQPYHFFQKVYDHVISKGHGFIVLASYSGHKIAGAVYFHFGDKGIYKYGASDLKFQDLRANNLVMWEGIRWFCNNGYKNFCFGRTELENEGLRQFKNGWGSEEHQIRYFKYSLAKEAFIPDKTKGAPIYTSFFRQLPMPALNVIGSWLYRHMG
jgi:hypothetical protein